MEYKYINTKEFSEACEDWDWYIKLQPYFKEYFFTPNAGKQDVEWLETRQEIIKFIQEQLFQNKLKFDKTKAEGFFDRERAPIDTIVIHHTSTISDSELEYLDALTLIRLYVPIFLDTKREYSMRPIFSGHLYQGKQTFIPYHYLIRADGKVEQILKDKYVGWQAGDWEVNCKSVAISFVDELEEKAPTNAAMKAAKEIISKYKGTKILGHCEITETECPGKLFLGKDGWKNQLL